jgi:hypothetical protein
MPHIGAAPTDSQASTRRFEDPFPYELKIQQMNLVVSVRTRGSHEPIERIDAATDAGVKACAVTATIA